MANEGSSFIASDVANHPRAAAEEAKDRIRAYASQGGVADEEPPVQMANPGLRDKPEEHPQRFGDPGLLPDQKQLDQAADKLSRDDKDAIQEAQASMTRPYEPQSTVPRMK